MNGEKTAWRGLPDTVARQRGDLARAFAAGLEENGLKWIKAWNGLACCPHNAATGKPYNGMNRLNLTMTAQVRGFKDPRWLTFNQAKKLGCTVKKGARSAAVERWKVFANPIEDADGNTLLDADGKPETRRYLRCVGYYRVFNAEEIDGLPELRLELPRDEEIDPIADGLIASSRCPVREVAADAACYIPSMDVINLPPRGAFNSPAERVATLLHEMAHSTGHASALNRTLNTLPFTAEYAREELVAEISAAFSCADLGISSEVDEGSEHFKSHMAYVNSWAQAVKDDPAAVYDAAARASKATDFIVSRWEAETGLEAPGRKAMEESALEEKAPGRENDRDTREEGREIPRPKRMHGMER